MSVEEQQVEKLSFGADVKQLLNLVANALYSNAEIFLRELVSNSSDAADKLRYFALSNNELYESDSDLSIHVAIDKENKTITVRDNGIGMTREDVMENLGTIAKSGTDAFREIVSKDEKSQSDLIGQFGVGFYSAFVVADQVVVRTRKAGASADQGVEWASSGDGEYTVKPITHAARGTTIIMHMKPEHLEFLDPMRLRNIIKKYSDHILFPIMMQKIDTPKVADDVDAETAADAESTADEVVILEDEQVNNASALWTLAKSEVSDEDYQDLYKHISHDFDDAIDWAHNQVEGKTEYTSLLYIPKRAPFDLWDPNVRRGLKLYVKRVFIMDNADQFLPFYMRFAKGVIDAKDLPLNISREMLQNNRVIERIKSGCVKRVLSMLEKMKDNDSEKYAQFWTAFGNVLKEGPAEDFANRDRVAKLLYFSSTHADQSTQTVSLTDYIERMIDGQDKIYYLTADSYAAAKSSPLLEVFKQKGIEVFLMSDRIDEWLMSHLTEFDGKKFQSIAKGELDLDALGDTVDDKTEAQKELEAEQKKEVEASFDAVLTQFKSALSERAKDVRLTERLTDSPACVVFDENDLSGHMQRLLQAAGQQVDPAKPILELNPQHAILQKLQASTDESTLSEWASVLLDMALLSEGEQLKDAAGFVKRLQQLLVV